jgi:hypothetical protein
MLVRGPTDRREAKVKVKVPIEERQRKMRFESDHDTINGELYYLIGNHYFRVRMPEWMHRMIANRASAKCRVRSK